MKTTKLSIALMTCGLVSAHAFAAEAPGTAVGGTASGALSTSKSTSPGQTRATSLSQNAVLNVSGQTIMDSSGQQVGKIQQVILNSGGCIDLAAISLQQGKVVAVPWQLVSFSPGSATVGGSGQINFTVKVDQAKLQQAPPFNVSHQNIDQSQTIQQVYQYYGVQQGTAQGAAGSGSVSTSPSSSQSTDPQSDTSLPGAATGPSDAQGKDLPPGLEKRNTLPPGLEKRDTLPPGLEKRGNGVDSGSTGSGSTGSGVGSGQSGFGNPSGHVEDKGNNIRKF